MNGWIPIKKMKPPLDTEVLVFQFRPFGTDIRIAEYIRLYGVGKARFGVNLSREKDGTVYSGFPITHVTHWMPLPKPPFQKIPPGLVNDTGRKTPEKPVESHPGASRSYRRDI